MRKILKHILKKLFNVWQFNVCGIFPKSSYIDHAGYHRQSRWIFQFDLKDAFSSVQISWLKNMLVRKWMKEIKEFEYFNSDDYGQEIIKSLFFFPLRKRWFMPRSEKGAQLSFRFPPTDEDIVQGLTDLILDLTTLEAV